MLQRKEHCGRQDRGHRLDKTMNDLQLQHESQPSIDVCKEDICLFVLKWTLYISSNQPIMKKKLSEADYLLLRLAPSTSCLWLQVDQTGEQEVRLVLCEGNICVVMEAKDVRRVVDGQGPDVCDRALQGQPTRTKRVRWWTRTLITFLATAL